MIGWWVIVSEQTPEERDADPDRKAKQLASWETGAGGLRWLHELVAKGEAWEHELKGGYPNRYTAMARDLLPLLEGGPPLSKGMDIYAYDEFAKESKMVWGDRNWNVILHSDRLAACAPDKRLTVEVWDQS